jgi:hypothetical protein
LDLTHFAAFVYVERVCVKEKEEREGEERKKKRGRREEKRGEKS